MAKTPSTMLELGTKAPEFNLRDTVTGRMLSLADFRGKKGLLVMFICNHCPFVIHVREKLAEIGRVYPERGLAVVGISANDVSTHPQDGPEAMKKEAAAAGYEFPYLYDETQSVAKAYAAACTPDFFLFDGDLKLVYRGQLDDSRPGSNVPVTGKDLLAAMDALLAGHAVTEKQKPSLGCNIKWKKGNEPEYYGAH
jgi:peroxiredoxin